MALLTTEKMLEVSRRRGILPTALDTEGIRAAFSAAVRKRSVFSAETTHAGYLETMRRTVENVMAGKYGMARARQVLRGALTKAGWTAAGGFPGDVPKREPAKGIKRLDSKARLDLIIRTQVALMKHAARRVAETDPARVAKFPAWQLVRERNSRVPRDWQRRWAAVDNGKETDGKFLIAPKWHPIWQRLGSSAKFADGLDSDTPPYAFYSGMTWKEVTAARAKRSLGKLNLPPAVKTEAVAAARAKALESKRALARLMGLGAKKTGGKITLPAAVKTGATNRRKR